jgi:hypothetical protein
MGTRKWEDIKNDLIGPPGSEARIAFEKESERWKKKQDRLDKIFGWMKAIPPYFPADIAADGYNNAYWKGLGPLMFLFWRTLVDEGFYGTLDMLAFHYFNDDYVLTLKDIRKNRQEARKFRTLKKEK